MTSLSYIIKKNAIYLFLFFSRIGKEEEK